MNDQTGVLLSVRDVIKRMYAGQMTEQTKSCSGAYKNMTMTKPDENMTTWS